MEFILFLIFFGCIFLLLYLTSGKINQKTDSITISTKRNVQEVVDVLRRTAGELKANVEPIKEDPVARDKVRSYVKKKTPPYAADRLWVWQRLFSYKYLRRSLQSSSSIEIRSLQRPFEVSSAALY